MIQSLKLILEDIHFGFFGWRTRNAINDWKYLISKPYREDNHKLFFHSLININESFIFNDSIYTTPWTAWERYISYNPTGNVTEFIKAQSSYTPSYNYYLYNTKKLSKAYFNLSRTQYLQRKYIAKLRKYILTKVPF